MPRQSALTGGNGNGNGAKTRVYRIKGNPNWPDAGIVTDRLVRAPAKGMALQHVARGFFAIHLATQEDMEEMLAKGVKVERYEAAPDEA